MTAPAVDTNYSTLATELEKQELEAPGGIPSALVYGQLLAIYLYQNDLPNAKLLWKRIPQGVKEQNSELNQIWFVGQKLWNRDFPGLYTSLNVEWPNHVAPIMIALTESTRARALHLVAKAYSTINTDDAASFLGASAEKTVEITTSLGWKSDRNNHFLMPKKPDPPTEGVAPSEEQLAKLTDFVAFLEN